MGPAFPSLPPGPHHRPLSRDGHSHLTEEETEAQHGQGSALEPLGGDAEEDVQASEAPPFLLSLEMQFEV